MGNSPSRSTTPGGNNQQGKKQKRHPAVKYPTAACRHLSAFPNAPSIKCMVGPDRVPYKYNAVIMASRSLFIDALLSSPITAWRRRDHKDAWSDGKGGKCIRNGSTGDGSGIKEDQEQEPAEMCQIDFSDVPEKTWLKMMSILEPGGLLTEQCNFMHIRDISEIVEVLGVSRVIWRRRLMSIKLKSHFSLFSL